MAIYFYSGTPGSGKSYHMAMDIWFKLLMGKNIISTENIKTEIVSKNGKKKIGDFVCVPILELEPKYLYEYAYKNHVRGKEKQTTVIIDEAQIIFDPVEFKGNSRRDWILFFTRHRKIGYEIIIISQNERLIARPIRSLFETEIKHRQLNHALWFIPFKVFYFIEYWHGNKMILSKSMKILNKKVASIYDTYSMLEDYEAMMAEELGKNKKTGYLKRISVGADDNQPETTSDCVTAELEYVPQSVTEESPTSPLPAASSAKMGRGPEGEGHPSKRPPQKGSWWMQSFLEAPIKGRKKAG